MKNIERRTRIGRFREYPMFIFIYTSNRCQPLAPKA
jgi:hypothetical protein